MDTQPNSPIDAGTLRFLKLLTGTLSAVMIVGIAVIVALLVMRLNAAPPAPPLPEAITLPDGAMPIAVTYGPGWYAVALRDAILIYDTGGTLRQTIPVDLVE